MKNKPTPGPWTVGERGVYWTDSISVMAPDGSAVCCTTRGGDFFDENGNHAPAWEDAYLIAAVHEMLDAAILARAALSELLMSRDPLVYSDALRALDAAIAKANGEAAP